MTTQVIVLNGGSSSGKTQIVRGLQAILPQPWLALGVDSLIEAMPEALHSTQTGIGFAADGGVTVGRRFRELEAAWMAGVVAIARAGTPVIVDDVFLGGADSQRRTREHLAEVDVLWVGVMCEPEIAERRERARGDRVGGMARRQALVVHEGVDYDVVVDTGRTEAAECARLIAARCE